MNVRRFDGLARAFATETPRRRVVRGLVGGIGAAVAVLTPRAVGPAFATQEATPSASPAVARSATRRNVRELGPAERDAFVDAVIALKRRPSPWVDGLSVYDSFVLWHRDAFDCSLMAAHMGPAFLPWHRMFLCLFEQQLQAIEPTVTLPYWDWTVDNTADGVPWGDDLMGGNGDPAADYAVTTGPFRRDAWEITVFDHGDERRVPYLVRDFGQGGMAPTLPSAAAVEAALAISTYDAAPWNATVAPGRSFRNALEGWRDCAAETCDPVAGMSPVCTGPHNLHNRVHLWVAGEFAFAHEGGRADAAGSTPVPSDDIFGTMAANTSLNDPVFWLHHANIDRLWNVWLVRHGSAYEPASGAPRGHNIDDAMWPYDQIGLTVTPRAMLSSLDLGYRYDTET